MSHCSQSSHFVLYLSCSSLSSFRRDMIVYKSLNKISKTPGFPFPFCICIDIYCSLMQFLSVISRKQWPIVSNYSLRMCMCVWFHSHYSNNDVVWQTGQMFLHQFSNGWEYKVSIQSSVLAIPYPTSIFYYFNYLLNFYSSLPKAIMLPLKVAYKKTEIQ